MEYLNQKEAHLMIWETNPQKRNLNNEIKFNLPISNKAMVGDIIKTSIGNGKYSCYELTEILEVRPSRLSKMNYITAKTKWYIN